MKFKDRISYALLYGLSRPLAALPLAFHRRCGRIAGRFAGKVLRYRRDVVMTNLSRCFPDMKYDELRQTADRFYLHFGKIFCEALWFGGCRGSRRLRDSHIAEVHGAELLNRFHDEGRSVFVMTTHCGNWELFGGMLDLCYEEEGIKFGIYDSAVIYRRLSNPVWDRFMARNRQTPVPDRSRFDGMVETFDTVRYVVRHRSESKLYLVNTDQFPYSGGDRTPVEFMHQPTLAMGGAHTLARMTHSPLVFLHFREDPVSGNYGISFELLCEDAAQISREEILARYYSLLGQDLREQPWNYLWTHKRWK